MTRCIHVLTVILFTTSIHFASAQPERNISDSLVSNLTCNNLSIETIYAHINTEAFSSNKHIPIRNWSFRNGPYSLGACWSLSHTQRLFFYLAQWGNLFSAYNSYSMPDSINILNLIRGSIPLKSSLGDIREAKLKQYYPFQIQSFATDSGVFADLINGIWDSLTITNTESFYPNKLEHGKLFRNLTTEVEKYQSWRFHQIQNSELTTEPVPRAPNINQKLAQTLMTDLDSKRLPMVDIKPNLTSQHVVLVKNYESTDELIKFIVYDSNSPKSDNYFIYLKSEQAFRASEIIKRFRGIKNPDQDVSVYLVDNEDHIKISNALFNYYKNICQ